jgi:hypothetical protein
MMGKFIFGFCTGCLATLCVVPVLLILVFAITGSSREERANKAVSEAYPDRASVSANIDESTGKYKETKPYGMSQAESNYIGNTAKENGYDEDEAKQIRDVIHKFNLAQEKK